MIQLPGASNLQDVKLDSELLSRRLDRCQLPRPGRRIYQDGDAATSRDRVFDQRKPFASQTGLIEEAPREVPTRLREAAGKPSLNGIALQIERHDRDHACGIFRRPYGRRAAHKEHVDLSSDQISGETSESLRLHAGEPNIEKYRPTLDVAEIAQTLPRGINRGRSRAYCGVQDTHHRHLPCLLPLR